MIGGQVLDIESEHQKPTPELVEAIHRAKTGALIRVSVVTGGSMPEPLRKMQPASTPSAAKPASRSRLLTSARMTVDSAHLGKTAGKDLATEKATWPAVYGIEQSQRDAAALIGEAFAALAPVRIPRRGLESSRPLPRGSKELT